MKIASKFALYVSDKYKSSLETTVIGASVVTAFFLGLGYYGYLSLAYTVWFASTPVVMLALVPASRILQSFLNLKHERKKTKAIVSILAITLGAILGGYLGLYLVNTMPVIASGLTTLVSATPGSIAVGIGASVVCTLIAERMGFTVLGLIAGSFFFSRPLFPVPVPFAVEAIVLGATAVAIISTIASKELLRAYYKLRYGHSNADAYFVFNYNDTNLQTQADRFGVDPQQIKDFNKAVIDTLSTLKKKHTLSTVEIRNTLKDLNYATLVATDDADVEQVKSVYRDCHTTLQLASPVDLNLSPLITSPQDPKLKASEYFDLYAQRLPTIRADLTLNTLYHSHKIECAMAKLLEQDPDAYAVHKEELTRTLEPFIFGK